MNRFDREIRLLWWLAATVVAVALALAFAATPKAGDGGVQTPGAQPVDAGAARAQAQAVDPYPRPPLDHFTALPDEEQPPTF